MSVVIISGVRRELRKRVPLQAGGDGFSTEPDGFEVCDISIEIDERRLAREYGIKAMVNKSGTTKYMHGCVVLKVVSRKKEPRNV